MVKQKNNSIETFFYPKGIVIVGARHSPGFGYGIPMNLYEKGWGDRIFLVNPKGGDIHGMHVYKSIADVPGPADLAIIIIPAPRIPEILSDLGKKSIRHVIIESAGFAEIGDNGKDLQDKVKLVLQGHNMRAIGPNCVGVVNTDNKLSTTETIEEAYRPGNTAIIAQSGVFGNILLDKLNLIGLFISKAVTLGNRIDVDEIEMLRYFLQDPLTKVIMMYLEGASDGRLLLQTLPSVTRDKPVLILKSGRTTEGLAATASHTGSLSGEDALYDGMFSQTGAIRVQSLDELLEFTRAFSSQPLPRGPRLGIVTGSGSIGALATDAAITSGLAISPPSESIISDLKKIAPDWMNIKNPLDVGPSGLFKEAFSAMLNDPDTDMVLTIITIPHAVFRIFHKIGRDLRQWFGDLKTIRQIDINKPVIACVVGHSEFLNQIAEMAGPDMPVFTSPEMAVKSLAALWKYQHWRLKHL